jgi:putative NADPH-quinone reductase
MQEKQMPSTPKKILVIMAHPGSNSLTQALAEEYQRGAIKSGAEARYLSLSELDFDPVLKEGYRGKQPMEPDLTKAQKDILWAQHLVFVYPIWWGAMPALLKGFIDRIFLPGFAFKYRKDSVWWDKLLAGRSARLITLMDTPPWYFRWVYRMPGHNQMKRTILEFCGVKPVRISSFGPVRGADEKQRENWLRKVYQTGLQQA